MKNSEQIRIRLSSNAAESLLTFPPRMRSRVVSMLVTAGLTNVDLAELLSARKELSALGNLLNQSLRISWGESVDEVALRGVIKKLEGLLR